MPFLWTINQISQIRELDTNKFPGAIYKKLISILYVFIKFTILTGIQGRENARVIKFADGSTFDLNIEVTAEDGKTIKTYTISVTSLAANSTYISSLKLKLYPLSPAFKQGVLKYESLVPSSCSHIEVSAIAPDKNTKIDIQPSSCNANNNNNQIKLNFGKTFVQVKVTSPDGTATLCYQIIIRRELFLFPLKFSSAKSNSKKFYCGICLQVVHCAVTVCGDVLFCQTCLQTVTRVNKKHPFTNRPIKMNDDVMLCQHDEECEISRQMVSCVCGALISIGNLVTHLNCKDQYDGCQKKLYVDEKTGITFVKGEEKTVWFLFFSFGLYFFIFMRFFIF